jgi:hypothetical protein
MLAHLEAMAACPRQERADRVRQVLAAAGALIDRLQLPVAKLLAEVQLGRYWASWGFHSFEDFVEADCKFSLRKAQELIKVYRKIVVELAVPEDRVRHLGWSKVALVAGKINPTNLGVVLDQVEKMSFAELKKLYKPSSKRQADAGGSERAGPSRLELTAILLMAIHRAEELTGSDNPQANLEYIAKVFLERRRFSVDGLISLN